MKLSVKVPLLIGIVVLVTSAGLGLLTLQASTAALTKSVINTLEAENKANAKLMRTLLNWELGILYEIANRPSTRTLDWKIVRSDLLPEVPRIKARQMALVMADGSYTSVINTTTNNVFDRSYFKKAMAEQGEGSRQILEGVGNVNEITRQVKGAKNREGIDTLIREVSRFKVG